MRGIPSCSSLGNFSANGTPRSKKSSVVRQGRLQHLDFVTGATEPIKGPQDSQKLDAKGDARITGLLREPLGRDDTPVPMGIRVHQGDEIGAQGIVGV